MKISRAFLRISKALYQSVRGRAFLRIGIFDPYLETLGGGERYTLTLAEHLSKNHQVEIFWDDQTLKDKIKNRLSLNLDKTRFVDNIFVRGKNLLYKLNKSSQYDLIFFLSDGSIPSTLAKRNILHFQCPFPYFLKRIFGKILLNKIKLSRFQEVICNSNFTKRYIDKEYGVISKVIYPPVDIDKFTPRAKENLIISVGRFSKYYINKKQKEMAGFFKNNLNSFRGWKLYLIGGLLEQDRAYFDQIEQSVKDVPQISLFPNESFEDLKEHYGQAKIYWHAAGFGVNENINPAGMEHFGISTVEAMAAGCVPIVFDGGGQREIVEHGVDGFLWKREEELIENTLRIVNDEKLRKEIAQKAIEKSKRFSKEKFKKEMGGLISGLFTK
ncbi:glycosyltransferase family 4 protein [Candidatus Gottesmanbacteria bacterium]|nr:glycosyltransferase family 4 protein [Candidatus Gottesmanbacteria bacterium]